MKCEDIRNAILRGRPLDGADFEKHLEECEACADLRASEGLTGILRCAEAEPEIQSPPLPEGVLDRIRSIRTPLRMTLVAGAILAVGALNAVALLRTDVEAYPPLLMAVILIAFTGAGIFGAVLVLRPIHRPRPDRRWLPGLVLLSILLATIVGLLPQAHHAFETHPESFEGQGADFWSRAIGCLIYGSVMGLPVLLLLQLVGRGATSRLMTVLGGLATMSLAGNVALQLHCPLVSPAHLLVGHAGVPIVLFLIGLPFALRRRRVETRGKIRPSM